MTIRIFILVTAVLAWLVAGCVEEQAEAPATAPAVSEKPAEESTLAVPELPKPVETTTPEETGTPVPDGEEGVLATVNGSPITREDLEHALVSMLGEHRAQKLDAAGRKKALESLVAGRAIAQAQEKRMSVGELAELDRKTEAYREQLLVAKYLSGHTKVEPVTMQMVKEYYDSHPEEFGAKTIRSYEMLVGERKMNKGEQRALTELLRDAPEKDWKNWAEGLRKKGYPLAFREGKVDGDVLHPALCRPAESLKPGETSETIFVKDIAYIVRITGVQRTAPLPLKQVAGDIRRKIAPVQMKKSVKEAYEQVLGQADTRIRFEP